jgi:hypothetical protein
MPIPQNAQELFLDNVPTKPHLVTLNVRVQPPTDSVQIYTSEEARQPIVCRGLSQITIECETGRIFVVRSSPQTHFEIAVQNLG